MYHQAIVKCGVQEDIYDLGSERLLEVLSKTSPIIQNLFCLVYSLTSPDLAGVDFGGGSVPRFWRMRGKSSTRTRIWESHRDQEDG